MGETSPPPPSDGRQSGPELRSPARVKESPLLAVPSPFVWGAAVVFTLLSAWLAIKLWSCGHELNALRASSELEHVAYRVLKNEFDAERLISEHLTRDLRKLEDSLKSPSSMVDSIPGRPGLTDFRIVQFQPARGTEKRGMALVVWSTGNQSGLALAESLPALSQGHEYRLGIAEAHGAPWQDAGTLAMDPSTGIGHIFFTHSTPLPESVRFAILRPSENAASGTAEAILISQ